MVGDLWSSLCCDMGHHMAVLFAAYMVALTLGFLGHELVENIPLHIRSQLVWPWTLTRNNYRDFREI